MSGAASRGSLRSESPDFLAGGGEMGARMRALDWSRTPLGPPEQWPQSLKTAVRIMLTSRQPMFVWWGDAAHQPLQRRLQGRSSAASTPGRSGSRPRVVWREIWDQVGPRAESAMVDNEGTYDEALLLIMERTATRRRPTTPSPTARSPTTTAAPAGSSAPTPTTPSASSASGSSACCASWRPARRTRAPSTRPATQRRACLATNPRDLPFALIYLVDADARRRGAGRRVRDRRGHPAAPRRPSLDDRLGAGPSPRCCGRTRPCLVADLAASFGTLPRGPGSGRRIRRSVAAHRAVRPDGRGRRPGRRAEPVPAASTTATAASSTWSPARSPPASPTPRPTRRSASAPRRWPSSTAPRPPSSPTSATSSARRSR